MSGNKNARRSWRSKRAKNPLRMCVHTTKNSTTNVGRKKGIHNRALYAIVIDWLELTLKQKDGPFYTLDEYGEPPELIVLSEQVTLIRRKSKNGKFYAGSKAYSAQYDVIYQGEEVAILHACNRFGKPELSQLKILNYLLYTDRWFTTLEQITEALQATVNNITRLDIAIDGRGFIVQHVRNRDRVRAGKFRKVGKAKTNLQENGSYEVEGFNVGTRKSGKLLTGYYKGDLLQKASKAGRDDKPYIPEYWQAQGLIKSKEEIPEIERLELKLSARQIAETKLKDDDKEEAIQIERLQELGYLAGIFQLHCNNFYQWIKQTQDTNVTRAKEVGTIDPVEWNYFEAVEVVRIKAKKKPSALWAARMAISFHMRESFVKAHLGAFENNSKADAAKEYCTLLAEVYGIEDWFYQKLKTWEKDQVHHSEIQEAVIAANLRKAIYPEPAFT